jgi:hypothetical protein
MEVPYEFLGKIFIYLTFFALAGIGIALLLGAYSFKNHKIIFPGFVLFTLYLFYSPAKWLCKVFRIRDTLVDDILIDIRNAVMFDDFLHTKGRRILLLPQCLRVIQFLDMSASIVGCVMSLNSVMPLVDVILGFL